MRVMCCRRTSSAVTSRSAVRRLVDGAAVSHPSSVGSCTAADAHLLSLARRWHTSTCDTAQRLLARNGCFRRQTFRSWVSGAAQQHPTSAGRLAKLNMDPARYQGTALTRVRVPDFRKPRGGGWRAKEAGHGPLGGRQSQSWSPRQRHG